MSTMQYTHYNDVPVAAWRWRHFSAKELACTHCGAVFFVVDALDRLEAVRVLYGAAIKVASFYRCPSHPMTLERLARGKAPGSHQRGTAVDPYPAEGGDLATMEDAFFTVGVLGRGKGLKDGKLHLHFDWDEKLGKRSWGY